MDPVKERANATGVCSGVWVVAPVEWVTIQSGEVLTGPVASRISAQGVKSGGALENDGSGRMSGDIRGQHNPDGAKDPWDHVALKAWRGRAGHALGPTGRNRARSQQERRVDQTSAVADGRADLTGGHVVLKPYWGKPTVRNFRGGVGNAARPAQARLCSTRQGRRAERESEGLILPTKAVRSRRRERASLWSCL